MKRLLLIGALLILAAVGVLALRNHSASTPTSSGLSAADLPKAPERAAEVASLPDRDSPGSNASAGSGTAETRALPPGKEAKEAPLPFSSAPPPAPKHKGGVGIDREFALGAPSGAPQIPSLVAGQSALSPSQPGSPEMSYPEAKAQVETTLRAQPKNYSLRMMAAAFYMNAGDHAAAIPHLQAATHLTTRVIPWIGLGDAATLAGRFALAQQAYDRARKMDPNNALIMRGQGQLYVAQQKFKDAERVLAAGLKRYPGNANLRAALGNLYLVINKPAKAIAVLEPAVRRDPTVADRHALLGEAYGRNLHLEAAIREMREAVRLDPNLSEAWGRLGLYLVNLTHYKEAREPLQRAISLEPMESYYYWALGDSYLLDKTEPNGFDQAVRLYRQALRLNPNNDKALYSYGMALSRRGRPEDLREAVPLFNRLLKLNPDDINAHYQIAQVYLRLGRPQEARPHQARFAALNKKGRNQIRALSQAAAYRDTAETHLKLGRAAMAKQNYALAAREFQLALERNRMLAEARQGMLEAQKRLGQSPNLKEGTP
ncbi:MAG TPA: tetratricopeptide repeat protein [Chthonomonadaceae bacterium]|nr:tetratricopeptide repeat protein [Chthonomonadaceae bacterium]